MHNVNLQDSRERDFERNPCTPVKYGPDNRNLTLALENFRMLSLLSTPDQLLWIFYASTVNPTFFIAEFIFR